MRKCQCCGQDIGWTWSESRLVSILRAEPLTKEEFTRQMWPIDHRKGLDLNARSKALFFAIKRKALANGIRIIGSGKGGRGNKGRFHVVQIDT